MEWMLLVHWNALSNCFLDTSKILAFILITECNCDASLACSARSANAMNIDLGHVREVVIDDMTDVGDIDAATGDICGDENLEGAVAEAAKGALTCALTLVSMDG